jgi:hypothetical protein
MENFVEISFEPEIKSYFLRDMEGGIHWAGAESAVFKLLVEDGFVPEDAREALLYARSTLGQWIDLAKFKRTFKVLESKGFAGFERRGITDADIERVIKAGPEFKGERSREALTRLVTDVSTVIGGINSTWSRVSRSLIERVPRMAEEELSEYVDLVNSIVDFLSAVNRYVGRLLR